MSHERPEELPGAGHGAGDPVGSLIGVLEAAAELVARPGNVFRWSSWNDAEEARAEIRA